MVAFNYIIKDAKNILVKPSNFFKEIKERHNFKQSLIFYIFWSIFISGLWQVFYFIKIQKIFYPNFINSLSLLGYFFTFVFLIFFQVLILVLVSLILYILLKIFKVKSKYKEILEIYFYIITPYAIFGWIFPILFGFWSIILLFNGLKSYYKISNLKLISVLIILFLLLIPFNIFLSKQINIQVNRQELIYKPIDSYEKHFDNIERFCRSNVWYQDTHDCKDGIEEEIFKLYPLDTLFEFCQIDHNGVRAICYYDAIKLAKDEFYEHIHSKCEEDSDKSVVEDCFLFLDKVFILKDDSPKLDILKEVFLLCINGAGGGTDKKWCFEHYIGDYKNTEDYQNYVDELRPLCEEQGWRGQRCLEWL